MTAVHASVALVNQPAGSFESFWLDSVNDDLTPRAALSGRVTADVVIVGGGFSGLWTAYYLLRDNPGIEVVVVEKEFCGFGASGRNGGWCGARFPVDADALEKRVGRDLARACFLTLFDAVEEIGRICAAEKIDAHYRKTPFLSLARGKQQVPCIHATQRAFEKLGLGDYNRLLTAREARDLVHATDIEGALLTTVGATVHPANLVRGLLKAIERMGGVVFEQSEVIDIQAGSNARLETAGGVAVARKALVIAAEAYLARMAQFARAVLPISSMIVLTAPLSAQQWKEIGWDGGHSIASQSQTKNYLTRTLDGRILYGSRGARYTFGSSTSDSAFEQEQSTFEWMKATVREWFPTLSKTPFTHAWGGYLGLPRDWMPVVNFDESRKLARLFGYTGRGVSTSNLAARLLAGLITKRITGLEGLPIHRTSPPAWEHEPLRWTAVRYLQNALERIDRRSEEGRSPPWDAPLAKYLMRQW